MKHIKLLNSILAATTAISSISLTTITSCSCSQVENITCDQKTQTIEGDYATYTFNLKDDLKSEDIVKPRSTCTYIKWFDYYIKDKKLIIKVALNLDNVPNLSQIDWDLTVYKTDNTLYGTVTGLVLQYEQSSICSVNFTTSSEGVTLDGKLSKYCKTGTTWGQLTKPDVTVKDGYISLGWYIDGTLTKLEDSTVIDDDITAKYYAIKYSDYFVNVTVQTTKTYSQIVYLQGGTWGGFKQYYGVTKDPEKTGHDFAGWYIGDVQINDSFVFPTGTTELKVVAKFIPQKRTIKFAKVKSTDTPWIHFNPENPDPVEVDYGTKWKDVPNKPTVTLQLEGMMDMGWCMNDTYNYIDDDAVVTDNFTATYIAVQRGRLCPVSFRVDMTLHSGRRWVDGHPWSEFETYYRSRKEWPNTDKEGYKFVGWLLNGQILDTSTFVFDVEKYQYLDLTASYEKI